MPRCAGRTADPSAKPARALGTERAWSRLLLAAALLAGLALGVGFGPTPGRLAEGTVSRALAAAAAWPAYRFSIEATSGGRVRAWARGTLASPGAVVDAGAENPGYPAFTFEAYFQPDAVYVRAGRAWHRVAYAHPAAVQLQDLQDPLRIWRRVLAAAQRVRRLPDGQVAIDPAWGSLGEYLTVDLRRVEAGEAVFSLGPRGVLRAAAAYLRLGAPDAFTGSARWTIVARFDPRGPIRRGALPAAARSARPIQ